MKRTFKFISICLVITIMCASSLLNSSATVVIDGDTVATEEMTFEKSEGLILDKSLSLEEQLNVISNSNSLSAAQKEQAFEKINEIANSEHSNLTNASRSNTLGYYITRAVPYFKQDEDWFCGPATTKQTIHFLTGTSADQGTIAKALHTTKAGTDGMSIIDYLNDNQNDVYYVDVTPQSDEWMVDCIYLGLDSYDSVPILRLKMTTAQGWRYNSDGHFMNISGLYSGFWSNEGACQYEVTDPYIERKVPAETDGKNKLYGGVQFYNGSSTTSFLLLGLTFKKVWQIVLINR